MVVIGKLLKVLLYADTQASNFIWMNLYAWRLGWQLQYRILDVIGFSRWIFSIITFSLFTSCVTVSKSYDCSFLCFPDFEDKPFTDFLKSQKMTSQLIHYVHHAIAMVPESATTRIVGTPQLPEYQLQVASCLFTSIYFPILCICLFGI